MPHPQTFQLLKAQYQTFLLRYRLFLCYQWFFQNIEKDLRFFFKMILFSQFPQNDITKKYISSIFFQYSDRTVASTETNDTSTERSDTELFGAGKSEGVALSRGLHPHLPQKDIEKKVNLTEPSQEAIFF